ncbi:MULTISPECIES: sigma-70 family RNA polymerase sigma factor [Clostridium]|uniref:RNA polymerase sigma factor SigM n=5 Tax=Clostridium TaxID=1485 RepID=D8GPF8_CLOLD|nr:MULTISPECIES: sigma-70 family RNA polymerase sigma factor [Clostridium]ADK16036.1 RNA polymerase sigma-E factor [Clostridium ljungdahlii DSM 13528]AGY75212.1 sigma-70 family RNA polymerase sigma factor [Clostridium autoethanogenum DSM 10061]ALU35382.1 RNA polymerase sigma-24 subunit [Clostridium autoethanogenum DSM 10061]OAA87088.1 RNA polymerase sigma factor SigM [Clostridium ljungdahlii DSM 13528]OAA93816.1 RNA polymerase sigma factor SigM [Clostridium coskatii]
MDEKIEELMNSYGNDVLRMAYLYLKDKYLAEDVFQEVFIKVYKNFSKLKKSSSEKNWIMTITINTCRDVLRISWFKKVILSKDVYDNSFVDICENVDDKVINKIQHEELLKQVMDMPRKYKEIIILYYYEELSTRDISKVLKIPEGTVRSRLFRARTVLKSNIDGKIEYER